MNPGATAMNHWQQPLVRPILAPGEVHLWRIRLDRDPAALARCADLLSADERGRMQRLRLDVHRERFALRRGALRIVLGRYLGIDPRAAAFRYTARGKPEIEQGRRQHTLRFNLSDSDDVALLAVALDEDVGVDVEHMRDITAMDAVARRFFSAREYEDYRRLEPGARRAGFFNCWTRKEAWLKARGDGLASDLRGFDVTLAPGQPARLQRVEAAPEEPGCWSWHAGEPLPEYVAAVAIRRPQSHLVAFAYTHD